jgi:DNA-binding phage protein
MANEAWHWYNARGLTGWVTPAGVYRLARSGMPALKSVITQDAAFRETLREGGSLLSQAPRNNAFMDSLFEKSLKEFSKTNEFKELAKSLGMKITGLYDALSKKSNIAMWTVRDMMYMQLINEEMMFRGLSRAEAIKEVERHMPSYRIPTKVMGSRMLSQVMQDPRVTVFSRYHYGLVNSVKETGKDLAAIKQGRAGLKHFLKGADTAAAIAVAIAALYPLQDMIAQALSGNEDDMQRRAGPYHLVHALNDIAQHEKDPMAFIAGVFSFNPALLWGAQLIANRKLYNGQPIYNPDNINEFTGIDGVGKVAEDIAKYTISTLPQAGQFIQARKYEDEGFQEWLMRQLDIVSPPSEKVMKQEKQQQKRVKGGTRQVMKWESDLD